MARVYAMSKKEGLVLLNSDNNFTPSDQNEHTVRRSTIASRNIGRKGLRNITNLPQQFNTLVTDEKSKLKAASTEECINKLMKENTSLLNQLADKDKIIDSSGIELQKLKAELHQIQRKNVELAQSNTQMLAVCLAYVPQFNVSYVLFYIFSSKILILGDVNVLLLQ